MNWSVVLAFLVDVLATFLTQLSLILMKQSHHNVEDQDNTEEDSKPKKGFCTKTWLLGLACLTVGSFLHIAVLPWLDLILASVNSASAIVFSLLLAHLMLKEKFVIRYDLTCFLLVVTGTTIILLLSN